MTTGGQSRAGSGRRLECCIGRCLAGGGLLKGRTVAIDATTLEANAAMRNRATGYGGPYQAYLTRLAAASGIKTPTREVLGFRHLEYTGPAPTIPAKVARMKDGRTHLHADQGDTTTLAETGRGGNNDLAAVGIRSYISEPDRGRRDWSHAPDAQAPVYRNRRRMRGARGGRLRRRRAELAERSFAHLYAMRVRICADTPTF